MQVQRRCLHALKRKRALIPTSRLFSKYSFQTPFILRKSLPENIHPSASLALVTWSSLHSFFFLPALTSILALLQVKVIQRIYTSKQNTSWTEDLERLMLTLTFNREAPPTETTCYPGMHCSLLIQMESSTNQKDHSKLEPVVSVGGTLHL